MVKLTLSILLLTLAHVVLGGKLTFRSRERSTEQFIFNGTDADIEDYPWIVSIRYFGDHICSGTILTANFVLSSVHCGPLPIGATNQIEYGTDEIGGTTNLVTVDRWIFHEGFKSEGNLNDIALVVPRVPLILSSRAQPVKLPVPMYEIAGSWETEATLIGFGIETRLQKVDLLVVSNDDCSNLHQSVIEESKICAGDREEYKGFCTGDDGGPLTLNSGELIGILTKNRGWCTVDGYPGVYTKVSHYIDWLEEKTGVEFH